VLVVDDDDDQRFLTLRALRALESSFTLLGIEDGRACIEYLRPCTKGDCAWPILVLLDLKMPMVSGFDVLDWAKAHGAMKHVVFMVLSTSESLTDVAKARKSGAHAYVCKLQLAVVCRALRKLSADSTHADVIALVQDDWVGEKRR
jgi:CheY-like chemotaxis protein